MAPDWCPVRRSTAIERNVVSEDTAQSAHIRGHTRRTGCVRIAAARPWPRSSVGRFSVFAAFRAGHEGRAGQS